MPSLKRSVAVLVVAIAITSLLSAQTGSATSGRVIAPIFRGPLHTPDSDAIACLQEGDTDCAVAVLEKAFIAAPFDDMLRESLFLSLIVHAQGKLMDGNLLLAQKATHRAKELMPNDSRLKYLSDVDRTFSTLLLHDSFTGENWLEASDDGVEIQYVTIPDWLGVNSRALAFTQKSPGQFNRFATVLTTPVHDFAMRVNVYAANSSSVGYVLLSFGETPAGYFTAQFSWGGDGMGAPSWQVNYFDSTTNEWTPIDNGYSDTISIQPKTWNAFEVRVSGQQASIYLANTLIGTSLVLDYDGGQLGFGAGLNDYATQPYSTVFDDLNIYSLK